MSTQRTYWALCCIMPRYLKVIKRLIEKGADVSAKVLHSAARNGHLKVLKWLVEKGAGVNTKDRLGMTVLHFAANNKQWEVVRWLVEEKNADVNTKTNGCTALDFAAGNRHLEVVKWLEKECKLDHVEKCGRTNCFLSCEYVYCSFVGIISDISPYI